MLGLQPISNFHRVSYVKVKMKIIGLCQLQAKIMVVFVAVTGK